MRQTWGKHEATISRTCHSQFVHTSQHSHYFSHQLLLSATTWLLILKYPSLPRVNLQALDALQIAGKIQENIWKIELVCPLTDVQNIMAKSIWTPSTLLNSIHPYIHPPTISSLLSLHFPMLSQSYLQRRFMDTLDIVDGCFCLPLDDCNVFGYMHEVDAMSRCVYKMFCYPFWIRSSRALVFNIESDNNVDDPPEHSWKIGERIAE